MPAQEGSGHQGGRASAWAAQRVQQKRAQAAAAPGPGPAAKVSMPGEGGSSRQRGRVSAWVAQRVQRKRARDLNNQVTQMFASLESQLSKGGRRGAPLGGALQLC